VSELPVEGTLARPVRLDPFQRIIAVHWGGFALLDITYTGGFPFGFSAETTQTVKSYSVGEIIAKTGVDAEAPLILVRLNEPNPIGMEPSGYAIKNLFGEAVLPVHPPITVEGPDPFDAQASYDAAIANFNAAMLAEYNRVLPLQAAALSAFLGLHPDAAVFRNVTDLREFLPEPAMGWGERSIVFLPIPWISIEGAAPQGKTETFTFPGYNTFGTRQGVVVQNLPPFSTAQVFGRYPTYADRNRDTYIIDTGKLGAATVDITLVAPNDQPVELVFLSGGGVYSAAAKRQVLHTVETATRTVRFVSGAGKAPGAVIARFDRAGFVV
jgi:hypothetical protein